MARVLVNAGKLSAKTAERLGEAVTRMPALITALEAAVRRLNHGTADAQAELLPALRDRQHPYHNALREAGPITVLDLEEAKSVTRSTLDTSTTIIVATRQAFQWRKRNAARCTSPAAR